MIPALADAETTITIEEPTAGDQYEAVTWTPVASGVRAVFSSPRGSARQVGGDQERIDMTLIADPCALKPSHRVTNTATGERWSVVWARKRAGLGIDHVAAGVVRYVGKARA